MYRGITTGSLVAAAAVSFPAFSASHLWDFWEIFSNEDGTIQFIEMHITTSAAQETGVGGKKISSMMTGKQFTFPGNLAGPTSFKYLLLATQSFADLPGAPTPDFIIPENFFATTGDTLTYHTYDTFSFTGAQLPEDCVKSLNRNKTTGVNSPTNYAGGTGSVDACPCVGDLDGSGAIDGADLGLLLSDWGSSGSVADLDGSGTVDGADLGQLLAGWGSCPA